MNKNENCYDVYRQFNFYFKKYFIDEKCMNDGLYDRITQRLNS